MISFLSHLFLNSEPQIAQGQTMESQLLLKSPPSIYSMVHARHSSRINNGLRGHDQQIVVFKRELCSRTQRWDSHGTRPQQQVIRKCPGLGAQPEVETQTLLYHLQTLPSSSHFFLPLSTFSTLEAQPQKRLYLETAQLVNQDEKYFKQPNATIAVTSGFILSPH